MSTRESVKADHRTEAEKKSDRRSLATIFGSGIAMTVAGIAIGIPAGIANAAQAREDMAVRAEGYKQCAVFVAAHNEREFALDSLSAALQEQCGVKRAIDSGIYSGEDRVRTYKLGDELNGKITATVVEYSKHTDTLSQVMVTLPPADNLSAVAAHLETQSHQANQIQDGLVGAGWGAFAGFAGWGAIARGMGSVYLERRS